MRTFQIIISAITCFCIVAAGAFMAVIIALAGQPLSRNALLACGATGLVAAMKDIRATMALPPLSNGNYEAIGNLIRESKRSGNGSSDTTLSYKPHDGKL